MPRTRRCGGARRFAASPSRGGGGGGGFSTPIVDVVFLLIVFFMLIAQLNDRVWAEIEPPVSSAEAREQADGAVLIEVRCDSAGRAAEVAVNGWIAPGVGWERAVEAALSLAEGGNAATVRVRADGGCGYAAVEPVLAVLRELGVGSVELVTRLSAGGGG